MRNGMLLLVLMSWAGSVFAEDLKPLLNQKGDLLFEEKFDKGIERWATPKGEWKVSEGVLTGAELEKDHHGAVVRTNLELPDTFVLSFDFKFDGAKTLHCSFNGKGHICRVTLTPKGFSMKGEVDKKDANDKAANIAQVKQDYEVGKWYSMIVEVRGEHFLARTDEKHAGYGAHAKVARAKNNFGFPIGGVSGSVRNVRVWKAQANPDWDSARKALPGLADAR